MRFTRVCASSESESEYERPRLRDVTEGGTNRERNRGAAGHPPHQSPSRCKARAVCQPDADEGGQRSKGWIKFWAQPCEPKISERASQKPDIRLRASARVGFAKLHSGFPKKHCWSHSRRDLLFLRLCFIPSQSRCEYICRSLGTLPDRPNQASKAATVSERLFGSILS